MGSIDWNEASRRGLIERINSEILHPLGLAMFRTPDNGNSPGLLIANDGVWEYAKGETQAEHRTKLLADLVLAAATLRRYEQAHRAKGTDDSTAKAEVNATLASRFEATIRAVGGDS